VRLEGLDKLKTRMTSDKKTKISSLKHFLHPVYCRLTIINILRMSEPEFGSEVSGYSLLLRKVHGGNTSSPSAQAALSSEQGIPNVMRAM
jgi:hypothetical protein